MAMRNATCWASLLLLMLSGCGSYFMPDRNIGEKLASVDVVGVWTLTDESMQLLKKNGYNPPAGSEHTIQFKADGTCVFRSAVPEMFDAKYSESIGTWELKHDRRDGDDKVANELWCAGGVFGFARVSGNLRLFISYGDPDQWEFIEYKREE